MGARRVLTSHWVIFFSDFVNFIGGWGVGGLGGLSMYVNTNSKIKSMLLNILGGNDSGNYTTSNRSII